MPKPTDRTYSRYAREAMSLLGRMIRIARIERKLTAAHGRALLGLQGNPFQQRVARRAAAPRRQTRFSRSRPRCALPHGYPPGAAVGITALEDLSMNRTAVFGLAALLAAAGGCANDEAPEATGTAANAPLEAETTMSDQMRESAQARTQTSELPPAPVDATAAAPAAGAPEQAHSATGTVTAVDPDQGKLTLEHGPVESLEWPPMTMSFEVEDPALLQDIEAGDTVEFSFVKGAGTSYVIREIAATDDDQP